MNVIRSLFFSCLVGVWIPLFAQSQLPPGMKMHRIAAGDLDASGWTLAKSTEGAFAVRLPFKFNDFTVLDDPSSAVSRAFVVGGIAEGGIKVTVTRIEYRAGANGAKQYFEESVKKGMGLGVDRSKLKVFVFASVPAAEGYACRSDGMCASMRALLAGNTTFLLAVEFPISRSQEMIPIAGKVFDSLVFEPM